MERLVIVSNRVPLPRQRGTQAGGLAVALRDVFGKAEGLWFGWSGEVTDQTSGELRFTRAGRMTYAVMDLGREDYERFYNGFSNACLWPLLHYRLGLLDFHREDYHGYMAVNRAMAAALKPLLRPWDRIWVHDYHLIPLGQELRKLGVENPIGFFLHTPFPPADLFESLPAHESLGECFASYDLVGLQTERDRRCFHGFVVRSLGGEVRADGKFEVFGRHSRMGAFGVGIDAAAFAELAAESGSGDETVRLKESLAGRQLAIGVDRLDFSKGLPSRFRAYGQLLERWPEHRSKVTYLQIAPHSRGEIAAYRTLRRELEQIAGRINGKHAEFDWQPLRYLNKALTRPVLAGFYRLSRIGLVTPLRDGMNLVAKEYVAAQPPQDPGVLILSRFAGAAESLTAALLVNPFDADSMADAMHAALVMPFEERHARWQAMMQQLKADGAAWWAHRFLATLDAASRDAHPLSPTGTQ
ncbi:trehalose-6-phosphate synthase [Hypericibacter terrae]|uniref:Trehalose-6-phosphate synthase n=1 Tax=Hypericibacter terrae TaxID=2602015 RepID=A0A5J6MP88_9PROT|nr:trehalose-6-phosphate synthase [Hypericibacter terrae]QEX19378.1 trehalose-6-phosphate synthase [Hypericibacter terrae]